MSVGRISGGFFRADLDLGRRWWHRLAKVGFVASTLAIMFCSTLIFHDDEQGVSSLNTQPVAQGAPITQGSSKAKPASQAPPGGGTRNAETVPIPQGAIVGSSTNSSAIDLSAGLIGNPAEAQLKTKNYFRIAYRVLLATIIWMLAVLATYYKGLIYVVYGHPVESQAHNNA